MSRFAVSKALLSLSALTGPLSVKSKRTRLSRGLVRRRIFTVGAALRSTETDATAAQACVARSFSRSPSFVQRHRAFRFRTAWRPPCDYERAGGPDAMHVQEPHGVTNRLLLGPTGVDARRPRRDRHRSTRPQSISDLRPSVVAIFANRSVKFKRI